MTSITRQDFGRLHRDGGTIHLDRMTPQLRQAFQDNGITEAELNTIAGQDRVIRGEAEFLRLFERMDRLDTDRDTSRLTLTDSTGTPTQVGRVFDAVQTEVAANRARAAREGGLRFAGDSTLENVAAGRDILSSGARGASVEKIQQALIDIGALGPDHGVTGVYDSATADAVRRFQRETGVGVDGRVGSETLSALTSAAPPPGKHLERSAEYNRLFADGRLDVTIAVGFDEGGANQTTERALLSGLRAQGYQVVDPTTLTAADRTRLGLTADRFDPNARYFSRTFRDATSGRDITSVVRLITPGTDGAQARRSFEQAMRQDEVVLYNGHARYGTGPDFDDMSSGAGNFVVDPHGNRTHHGPPAGLRSALSGRSSDLSGLSGRPDYQLLVFDACSTEEYLHNLRDPGVFSGRSMGNTDIITTQTQPRFMWTGEPALRFLQGLSQRETNNTMFRDQATMEQAYLRRHGLDSEVGDAGHTFVENGFLGNSANRVVPNTP